MTTYSTGSSEIRRPVAYTGSGEHRNTVSPQKDSFERVTSSRQNSPEDAKRRNLEQALARTQQAVRPFDRALLERARDLLESIDSTDQVTATVNLAEIGTMVASLWETADQVSSIHRQILASLDAGILAFLASSSIEREQLDALREGMGDLSMPTVSEIQAEAIRSRLIDVGKKPLFILSNAKEDLSDDKLD